MLNKSYIFIFLILYIVFICNFGAISNVSATGNSGLNIAPNITSQTTYTIPEGTTNIGTVTATDDAKNTILEYGNNTVTGNTWKTLTHSEMCNPVVVSSVRANLPGETQRVVRVNEKQNTMFDIKVDNQFGNVPATDTTDIDWVVITAGSYDLIDDSNNIFQIQAGSINTNTIFGRACRTNTTTSSVNFSPAFTGSPSVIHSISSNNDITSVASMVNGSNGTRASEPSSTQMGTFLQRGHGACIHDPEIIDYLAMEQGHFVFNGGEVDAVVSTDSIAGPNANGYPINFTSNFSSAPQTLLTSQLGEDGGDGGFGVVHANVAPTVSSFRVSVDEDANTSRGHTTEVFGGLAFENTSGTISEENILEYNIVGGTDASNFSLDANTGALTSNTPLTFGNYTFDISVCDSHCNSLCDTETITINVTETTPPVISNTNFSNNTLLPGGNHDVVIEYSDANSGIDIASASFELFKWDGVSSYGTDISSTNSTTGTISTIQANYTLDNLSLGKYQYIFSISDTAGNTSSETIEFYIDVPEFTVSDEVIDIGDIDSISTNYSNTITLTVKTIGAAFDLITNMPIPDLVYTPDLITPWNGTHGFGFALAPYTSITAIGTNQLLFSESKNINSNGNLNTYTYDLKLGALSEVLQAAGEYQGNIDFGIEFQY